MKEVVNHRQLEYLIHRVFHDLADKYELDVDLVGEVIKEYCEVMEENIRAIIVISEN